MCENTISFFRICICDLSSLSSHENNFLKYQEKKTKLEMEKQMPKCWNSLKAKKRAISKPKMR